MKYKNESQGIGMLIILTKDDKTFYEAENLDQLKRLSKVLLGLSVGFISMCSKDELIDAFRARGFSVSERRG